MKTKPGWFGMKIWVWADAQTSYGGNLKIYLDKQAAGPDEGKVNVLA
jgi:hypothetical protein